MRITYRKDIDGLRAIAVLLVLISHFELIGAVTGGFIGVDVFFVISGYLVTALIKHDLDAGAFDIADFYRRRIARLFPALAVVSVATFAAGLLLFYPKDLDKLAEQLAFTQIYASNFYFRLNINYFDLDADNVPFLHTWSLAVEEQFYLIFPIVLTIIFKFRRFMLLAFILGIVMSFALNLYFVGSKPQFTFYLLPTRAWEFLIGAVIAWTQGQYRIDRRLAQLIGFVGLAMIGLGAVTIDASTAFPGIAAVLPAGGAALFITAGLSASGGWMTPLTHPIARYVGKISYSLYLVHWPIGVFAQYHLGHDYPFANRLTLFALSFVLASTLYHFIERPMRRGLNVASMVGVFVRYGAASAALVAVSIALIAMDGAPQRYPDKVLRVLADNESDALRYRSCQWPRKPDPNCYVGDAGVEPDWLIWGDSHAPALGAAISDWLKMKNESGVLSFSPGCTLLFGAKPKTANYGRCVGYNNAVEQVLNGPDPPRNVLIVSLWYTHLVDDLADVDGDKSESAEAVFTRRFESTMQDLNNRGVNVYLWLPLPVAPLPAPRMIATGLLLNKKVYFITTLEHYNQRNALILEMAEQHSALFAGVFRPVDEICSGGSCDFTINGLPLYSDNSHPSKASREFFTNLLIKQTEGFEKLTMRDH